MIECDFGLDSSLPVAELKSIFYERSPRRFLGSSLLVLGSTLLDALATPVWQWKSRLMLQSSPNVSSSPVQFVDVAKEAGLTVPNVWGDPNHKKYIIEAKGSGLAFFDYDHDGWLDIF